LLAAGERIGTYEIICHLASGGMGELFLGRRIGIAGFTRPVAIKVINAGRSRDSRLVEQFIREARLSARIDHPNVVRVEELASASENRYLLVMEYVGGCSLRELLSSMEDRQFRLHAPAVVSIGAAIAEGLHAAHETTDEQGRPLCIIHRDVSPHNILISTTGQVKLIDFGIAKPTNFVGEHTQAGAIKGKVRYMSPEQARGLPVDRRADVYALGIVLWEMLTMRRLFRGPTDVALDAARTPQIPPASAFDPSIPRALDRAIEAALAYDPEYRPESARDLRRMLFEAVPEAQKLEAWELGALVERLVPKAVERARLLLPKDIISEAAETTHLEVPWFVGPLGERAAAEEDRDVTDTRLPPVPLEPAMHEHHTSTERHFESRASQLSKPGRLRVSMLVVIGALIVVLTSILIAGGRDERAIAVMPEAQIISVKSATQAAAPPEPAPAAEPAPPPATVEATETSPPAAPHRPTNPARTRRDPPGSVRKARAGGPRPQNKPDLGKPRIVDGVPLDERLE
jgi:serine/threonine-protein kinase